MIEPRELRIGNWVNFIPDNGDFIVSSIDASNRLCKTINGLCMNDIKPIPLTDEILLKCGFYWDKKKVYLCLNETAFRIRYSRNQLTLFQSIQYLTIPDIKHLHQLQNIYFALTQKELEIKFL